MKELAYARHVLEVLASADPNLVVYGGALRDTFAGNPVKDIDIAFYSEYIPDQQRFLDAIGDSGLFINNPPKMEDLESEQYDAGEDSDFECYFQMIPKKEGMPDVEFVGVTIEPFCPKAVADRCDWGFCQSAFDLKEVYQSVNYKIDMFNQTATYCVKNPCKEAIKHSVGRKKRLAKKFPGWEFHMPDHLIKKHKLRGFKAFNVNDEKGKQHVYY